MENVAEHINKMQHIHREYGAIFDHLFRQHQKSCKQVRCLEIDTPHFGCFIRSCWLFLYSPSISAPANCSTIALYSSTKLKQMQMEFQGFFCSCPQQQRVAAFVLVHKNKLKTTKRTMQIVEFSSV